MGKAKEVTVELDGAPVALRFDFNALEIIEDLTGRNMLVDEMKDVRAKDLKAIVYACHAAYCEAHGTEALTLGEIGSRLHGESATQAWGAITGLASDNGPEPGKGNPREAPAEVGADSP